jgi:hypothetical protein
VVIVDDAAAIRRAVGGRVDAVFTPTRDEAEAPRKDLARYLQAERKREKDGYRRTQLHQIEAAIDRYFWHCGGYVRDKQKYLYCSFVLIDQPSELASLRRKQFPDIDDGGTSVCNCSFSLKTGHIVRLEWNGEA